MSDLDSYLTELTARLRAILGANLVGVYAGGSYALGDWRAGSSDIDLAAVVRAAPSRTQKDELVAALRHEELACPALGLEFVLYTAAVAGHASPAAGFELNLNTGAAIDSRVDYEPGAIEEHWFPIDRSILAEHGVALRGPAAETVFARYPRATILPLVRRSLRWHADAAPAPDDAVLNACRAWRFAAEGSWSSKTSAGEWAAGRNGGEIVERALAARAGHGGVDAEAARRFVEAVDAELR